VWRFNVDYLLNDNQKQQLLALLTSFNMIHTVNFPTRLQNNHASAIDSVFVDESRLSSCITFPISNALSDHDAQCLILDKYFVTVNKTNNKLRNKFNSRLITCETINYFSEQLSNETLEEVHHNTVTCYLRSQPIQRFIAGQQLHNTQQALEKLLGSRPRLTMEIQLEGVFYVVRPDAISRQLPVTSSSSERDTVEYSSVPGVD
jgi:hypothetical protein